MLHSVLSNSGSSVIFLVCLLDCFPTCPRRFHGAVVLCLVLLSVFLLIGLISLGVYYHNSVRGADDEFSTIKTNLTELLQNSQKELSSLTEEKNKLKTNLNEMTEERNQLKTNLTEMTEERNKLKTNVNEMTEERGQLKTNLNEMTEERDQLKTNLTEMTEENNRLQCLFRLNKTCPAGWTKFSCFCYFLSSKTGSWTEGRQDCRTRGADLVVIDSDEEQTFLSNFTKAEMWSWIGLTDGEHENTWKWIDGTPLTLSYWEEDQPDNWHEEDCAHIRTGKKTKGHWNDLSCNNSLYWICEKKA